MRPLAREVHDAVAGGDRGRAPLMPCQTPPGEDVEDLLLVAVLVRRGRPTTRRELDPPHAGPERSRRIAKERPGRAQMAGLEAAAGCVLEVRDPHRPAATIRPAQRARSASIGFDRL